MADTVKLPAPPTEVKRNRSVDGLAPLLREAMFSWQAEMGSRGHPVQIFETLRNDDRQRHLFGFGRTWDDGRGIVTYSETADDTWHGFGLAFDAIPADGDWNDMKTFRLGAELAINHGLTSGADWNRNGQTDDERFKDWPHFQWGRLRRSPSPNAARIVEERGLAGLWAFVGAA